MEWLLLCLVLLLVFAPLLLRLRSLPKWLSAVALAVLLLSLGGAALRDKNVQQQTKSRSELSRTIPSQGGPPGYISSDKCQACHPDQYTSWHNSFHRTMTQVATAEAVKGNFENVSLELDGHSYHLERRGDEFWAEMVDPDWVHDRARAERDYLMGTSKTPPPPVANPPRVRKQIGMTTGSHHFQAYWVASRRYGNVQFAFPWAWLIEDQRWVPRKDTFIRDPNGTSPVQIWNMNCIMCHATAGQPRKSPETALFASRVGELGIACESCHGPAEEHVRANLDPLRRYNLHRAGKADSTILNPARQSSKASTQVCGQCHGMKWNLHQKDWLAHGLPYRPGDDLEKLMPLIRPTQFDSQPWLPDQMKKDQEFLNTMFWPDGMIRVTGREYNGLIESACYTKGNLSCLSCHSMHKSKPDDQLASGMSGSQACLQCHNGYREKIEQHTHHRAGSSGSDCYNCHMPHNTYGLLKAVRSHFIESPNLKGTLAAGRPNACNLCHLDKTLAWTGQYLSEWYGQAPAQLDSEQQSISAAILWLLRGDAAQRSLVAWNMGWREARQASGESWLAPFVTQLLDDPYSAVRYIVYRSLRKLPGYEGFDYDYIARPEARKAAQKMAFEIWNKNSEPKPEVTGGRVLIDANGRLRQEKIDQLLQQRDNRPVELIE